MVMRRWEIHNLGLDMKKEVQLSSVSDDQILKFTMGCGAGENVMHEKWRQGLPPRYSDERDAGVLYTTANGETMPNRGKNVRQVVTKEGHARVMNVQITDLNKALVSVARIFGAGNTVMFKKGGGIIKNK